MEQLELDKRRLYSMPSLEEARTEAEEIRRSLKLHFQSEEHLKAMNYEEKRRLMHWLFDGKDSEGAPYAIYVSRRGKGEYEYFIYGLLIQGLRVVKGEDIDSGMSKLNFEECARNAEPLPVVEKQRPSDDVYEGPRYEGWLASIAQTEDYKTCSLSRNRKNNLWPQILS